MLATFGLILFFNKLVQVIWGPAGLSIALPPWLAQQIEILPGVPYPLYRLAITLVSLTVAGGLWFLIARTRTGMLIRAGASNRRMVSALGVDIKWLFTLVFGLGAGLAGLAGVMYAPISTVFSGMGEEVLIQAFVVIVIGGIGSIRGAFIASIGLGLIDTLGPRVPGRSVQARHGADRRLDGRAGAGVDADLPHHGGRAGVAADRPVRAELRR